MAANRGTRSETDGSKPLNLLIVKPSSLGDIVHAFPAVALLRQRFPDAMIAWLANDSLCSVVELCPAVDLVIPFQRQRWGKLRHAWELPGFVRELQLHNFDAVLDFQGLLRSGLLAYFCGARRRIGFAQAREGAAHFYNEKVLLPANLKHAVEKNLFLARAAFAIGADQASSTPLTTQAHTQADACKLLRTLDLSPDDMLIAVAPAARWQTKQWAPTKFAAVLDRVAALLPEARFWICGAADETAVGAAVVAACRRAVVANCMGRTSLPLLAELLRRSRTLLTNDSGPMHLAALAGTAVVALFGPTDPVLTGPYGPQHQVFQGNCAHAACMLRSCRMAAEQCFAGIDVEQVAVALVEKARAACPDNTLNAIQPKAQS